MKRSGDEEPSPRDKEDARRRQFEESRGLSGERELDLPDFEPENEPEDAGESNRDEEEGVR